MSLIQCRECEKEISGSALVCPQCGCVTPNKKVNKGISMYVIISGIIALIIFLAALSRFGQ